MRRSLGIRALERLAPPPRGVVVGSGFSAGSECEADVEIVTNCAFQGGNGTTVTEFTAFERMGLETLIVHCPVKRSPWNRT